MRQTKDPFVSAMLGLLLLGQIVLLMSVASRIQSLEVRTEEQKDLVTFRLRALEGFVAHITDGDWPRLDVTAYQPTEGTVGAPLQIVEFADFLCPGCAAIAEGLRQFVKENGDAVAIHFINFPIPNAGRASSVPAALGGICANEQDVFWPYHDELYRNQEELTVMGEAFVFEVGRNLGLDQDAFRSCLESSETRERLQNDYYLAGAYAVLETPTLFVNGRRIVGASQWELLEPILRRALDGIPGKELAIEND